VGHFVAKHTGHPFVLILFLVLFRDLFIGVRLVSERFERFFLLFNLFKLLVKKNTTDVEWTIT
jgi:hypothetical protein